MKKGFDEYLNLFQDYLKAERHASPYTIRDYMWNLREFADFAIGKGRNTPSEVDKLMVRDFLGVLKGQGQAASTINNKLSALRSFYKYLMREGIISENPLAGISSPKLGRYLPSFLTVDEARRLVESPDLARPQGQRDRALLELLYASGLRVSELVDMNVEQVNLITNEIRVRGKGSKDRVTLLGGAAARALENYMNDGRLALLKGKKENALFVNHLGGRLPARRVQKILDKYARTIDKKVHPHMLRHTFATHLLDGGADLKVVQELLGHADLSSTQVYTHVTQSQARKIYLAAHPMARENEDDRE